MNVCGYYYIGNIGIFGVDKKGSEFYQVFLGGNFGCDVKVGKIMGFFFFENDIVDVIIKIIDVYVEKCIEGEFFLLMYECVGMDLFKECVYVV